MLAILIVLADLPARSQQNAPITVNVNAVNLLATVRDKHGNIVSNLSKDDFSLDQDGKPERLHVFQKNPIFR